MDSGTSFIISAMPWVLGGYLLGSIPFGLLLTKWAGLGDIRNVGSGNIGATNVLRTGNKGIALATLLLDAFKGAVALLIARYVAGEPYAVIAGGAAFVGHIFPIWLRFDGGKGVATFAGTLFAANLGVGVLAAISWGLIVIIFRISSLGALVTAVMVPLIFTISGLDEWFWTSVLMSALVLIRHKDNINRLRRGEEPKIGDKKKSEAEA